MKNPIQSAREAEDLTRTEAAIKMGANYFSLMRLERGLVGSLTEIWRPRFELMGWDFEQIKTQYSAWHEAQKGAPIGKAAHHG